MLISFFATPFCCYVGAWVMGSEFHPHGKLKIVISTLSKVILELCLLGKEPNKRIFKEGALFPQYDFSCFGTTHHHCVSDCKIKLLLTFCEAAS